MPRAVVLHGPNIDALVRREAESDARLTLAEIDRRIGEEADRLSIEVHAEQHNGDAELVAAVARAGAEADGIVLNVAAYAHDANALRDAIAAAPVPTIEVRLDNGAAYDPCRATSVIAPVVRGSIAGFGVVSYLLALSALRALWATAPSAGGDDRDDDARALD